MRQTKRNKKNRPVDPFAAVCRPVRKGRRATFSRRAAGWASDAPKGDSLSPLY